MNILVTGSSGFIGDSLVKSLNQIGHNVYCFSSKDGDIFNYNFISQYKNTQIDLVYHLAGKTFVPDSWNNPSSFITTNTMGTLNILKFCEVKKIPLIYVSAYIYGNDISIPISETSEAKPNNPYALSKFMAEELCTFYSRYKGMSINIFRPFNVFGTNQDGRFLIPEIFSQVKGGKSIIVNTLKPKRDYIYIDDLIEGLILGMNSFDGLEIYNLGSGYSLSVERVINIIQQEMSSNLEVISRNSERDNEIDNVLADISKAKKKLSWEPKNSFDDGIKTIAKALIN